MVPSDPRLLSEDFVVFVKRGVVSVSERVGSPIAVMSIEVVEETGAE